MRTTRQGKPVMHPRVLSESELTAVVGGVYHVEVPEGPGGPDPTGTLGDGTIGGVWVPGAYPPPKILPPSKG
jgi:hypothetical protein